MTDTAQTLPHTPPTGADEPRLIRDIRAFIGDPAFSDPGSSDSAASTFDELARRIFAFQYERVAPYRALAERRGVRPDGLDDWRRAPAVPTSAFRRLRLAAAEPVEVFRSSGTTGGADAGEDGAEPGEGRSVHYHPYPELYRHAIDASFPRFCLPGGGAAVRLPILSLIPPREDLPDSSLSFMVNHVIQRHGTEAAAYAFGNRGLSFPALRSWLSARQRSHQPALVLTTSFALVHALDRLEKVGLRFRLAPGSVVFETGGFKGKTREVERPDLLARLEEYMGVPASQVVREYGMTELSSQLYTPNLLPPSPNSAGTLPSVADRRELFVAPHWVRWRVLDPETLQEAPEGRPGLIAVFDLANAGSAAHVLTEDLGRAEGGGLRLLGRAAGSQLRGCSLAAEEILEAGGG